MEVIDGMNVSGELITLISQATKELVLVSPYFDPWDLLSAEIRRAVKRPGIKVILLLRAGHDRKKREERAAEFIKFGVEVHFLERLHAKIYISDSQALLTSLNLLESSALNSWEIAMRATHAADPAIYETIRQKAENLLRRAREDERDAAAPRTPAAKVTAPVPAPPAASKLTAAIIARAKGKPARVVMGMCIRCAAEIPNNPKEPYCAEHLKSWKRYKNDDYEEQFCHVCGAPEPTSMAKPLCWSCWKESA